MDGKNCADRDNPQGSVTPGWERRTFRDYNQVGASLRDSPIPRETWSKEVRQLTTAQGFGGIIVVVDVEFNLSPKYIIIILVVMASSRGNSSSNSVYFSCCS